MHLTADTINLGNAISLPILDPLFQTLQLAIAVPITLQVIVIDEELQILRVSTSISKALASCSYSSANIIKVTQVILPVEIVLGIIGRNCTTCGRLEIIETIAILEGTLILKLPSKSVTAPTLALPFTFTVAPIRGSPVPSTRLP